jgi:hypothetical protein
MVFSRFGVSGVLTTVLLGAIGLGATISACGSDSGAGANGGVGGDGGDDGSIGDDGSSNGGEGGLDASNYPCDGCASFPPLNAPECDPSVLGKPKLAYPVDGILLPPNMNVLEVQFVPPTGATLFEVDFENAITDVRVETQCNSITSVRGKPNVGCGLLLSQNEWNDIANKNRDGDPLKVIVRATSNGQCVATSQESVSVDFAKEDLAGGIYYWQSATFGGNAGTTGGIFSHDFGTLDPTPTPFYTSGGTGTCVGCHTLSRDGARMALMTDDPDADDEYGDVKTHVMDVSSRTVIGGANVGPGFQTFTHDHAKMVASTWKQANKAFAVWSGDGTQLLTTQTLPNNMQGTQPNMSKDDKTLVFVVPAASTISQQAGDHHFMGGSLWRASFDATSGALSNHAAFLASNGSQNFYYPDQSSDGNWVVFNEADDTSSANNNDDAFYNRKARVKLLHFPPQNGDKPLDLGALNVADGLSNSWPRWSPFVQTYKNHFILWVTFSSNRSYGVRLDNQGFDNYYPPESPSYDQPQPPSKQGIKFDAYASPQIWMAAIIIDSDRSLDASDRSYPAFWLPFQDVTAHNHSAQWVEKVQAPPPPSDGGIGGCNPPCASNQVCCPGSPSTCQDTCIR